MAFQELLKTWVAMLATFPVLALSVVLVAAVASDWSDPAELAVLVTALAGLITALVALVKAVRGDARTTDGSKGL